MNSSHPFSVAMASLFKAVVSSSSSTSSSFVCDLGLVSVIRVVGADDCGFEGTSYCFHGSMVSRSRALLRTLAMFRRPVVKKALIRVNWLIELRADAPALLTAFLKSSQREVVGLTSIGGVLVGGGGAVGEAIVGSVLLSSFFFSR